MFVNHPCLPKRGLGETIHKVKGHSGDVWNEIADALAAIGRTIAVGREPRTAELLDRLQGAVDGIDAEEPPHVTCV